MTKSLAEMSEREYFANVRRRLPMYVIDGRLDRLEAFLDGYDQHALRPGGPGLRDWTDRLIATCSQGWSEQIAEMRAARDCLATAIGNVDILLDMLNGMTALLGED
ncbi:hypothetical protein [Streptosporangium roseum]|uniref:Uncharacterized protein n=1 Tax=Streptosporangium roseum (strain ATCC 12428 / DSM 43021 / JCM 3005 / KCTC 9067 / NCIMB 10171 / NRRL 2505 / NI 9100) TaxID=479432 RepID=D2B3H7_STRRD|nr:hypothetical protein [Streptosporangium roseum]ACZ87493.1 hypothetical protein Sros_4636 [Streptosporangium roseum DSM 43021]